MRIDADLIARFGEPQHKPEKGFRYRGGVFATRPPPKGSHPWQGGLAQCLWCGHVHDIMQGVGLVPSYHFDGCVAGAVST